MASSKDVSTTDDTSAFFLSYDSPFVCAVMAQRFEAKDIVVLGYSLNKLIIRRTMPLSEFTRLESEMRNVLPPWRSLCSVQYPLHCSIHHYLASDSKCIKDDVSNVCSYPENAIQIFASVLHQDTGIYDYVINYASDSAKLDLLAGMYSAEGFAVKVASDVVHVINSKGVTADIMAGLNACVFREVGGGMQISRLPT